MFNEMMYYFSMDPRAFLAGALVATIFAVGSLAVLLLANYVFNG